MKLHSADSKKACRQFSGTLLFLLALAVASLSSLVLSARSRAPESLEGPIHFKFQPVDFTLDSNETPERHAPETMAGGVAIFDYDNDGYLDIFFTNGADIHTLKKSSPKSVDQIEIRWPSGIVQTLKNIRSDQVLHVTESR